MDPWILDRQDPRYRDFQYWLEYDKRVSQSSSNDYGEGPRWQNGGVVHKIHYTYLIDKLLRPLENVNPYKYNIKNEDIKKMALKRRDIRRKQRIKMEKMRLKREQEDSDEEDLETIKKRLDNKKKGRFYIDKPRGHETIPEQEMRIGTESSVHRAGKRRMETSDMVADLGYMESNRKKNKRSAGSHIKADARRHFNEDGTVKTGQLLQDHGFIDMPTRISEYLRNLPGNIQKYSQSHPLNNRPATFSDSNKWNRQLKQEFKQENVKREAFKRETKFFPSTSTQAEEITLSDSDSDIEVLSDTESSGHVVNEVEHQEMKLPPGIVMITHPASDEDDDIVVLEGDEEPVTDHTEDTTVEDKKPALKDLIARSKRLPEIVLCSSDSEEEEVTVPKISNIAHDDIAADEEIAETREETTAEDTSKDMEIVSEKTTAGDIEVVSKKDKASEVTRKETPSVAIEQPPDVDISMDIREECMRMIEDEDVDETREDAIDKDISRSVENQPSVDKQIVMDERMEEEPTVLGEGDMEVVTDKEPEQVVPDTEDQTETVQRITSFLEEQSFPPPTEEETSSLSQDKTASIIAPTSKSQDVPAVKEPQLTVPRLDFSSPLLQNLNSTIVRNEGDKCDHLVSSHVFIPNTLYDKNKKGPKTLTPVSSHILQEFDLFSCYQETQDVGTTSRRRAPRKGKKKQGNLDPEPEPSGLGMEVAMLRNMMISLSLLKMSSSSMIQPEILNVIWRKFLLDSHPSIVSQTDMFLRQYFMLRFGKRGCHRETIADSVLSSLREVTQWSMFKTFDKTNPRDLSMVTSFVQDIVDKSVDGAPGASTLLNIIIHVCDQDFKVWRLGNVGSYPLLYYIFGGIQNFSRNVTRMLALLIKVDKVDVRTLTALAAMMTASLDDKEREALVSQGSKVTLAEAVANALEDDHEKITLLQPSWFSFLVSKHLLEKQTSSSFKQLRDFHGVRDDNSLLLEIAAYKYMAYQNLAEMLRGTWFYGSKEDEDEGKFFEVYSKLKNLSLDKKSSESKYVVMMKTNIRFKVKTQTQDLHLLGNISKGCGGNNQGEPQGALQALFFRMSLESDLDWLSFAA